MNKVSLNDAFLVRCISKGPTRNRCRVTATDIIGKRTPYLDPEVLCCKIWSRIVLCLDKHEIGPKYGILSQWWLHTKSTKTSQYTVLLSSWRYHVYDFFGLNHLMKAGIKLNDTVTPLVSVHYLNHIFRQLLWPLKTKNIATPLQSDTKYVHHLQNDCLCWLFLIAVDIIKD